MREAEKSGGLERGMEMQSARTNRGRAAQGRAGYVEGSAARNLYEFPRENSPRRAPARAPKKTEAPKRRTAARRAPAALPVSGISVLVLATAAVLTLCICIQYVQLQSEITYRLKNINQLEAELSNLTVLNNETEKKILCFIDLSYIYQVATEELGMRYAQKDQITLYNNSGSEYVRQYKDIPE